MSNSGKYNKRVTYTMPGTVTDDGYGGDVTTPGAEVETWGSARPLRMDETLRYGLPEGSIAYEFGFRYYQGKNILISSNVKYKTKNYKVNSVIEVDEEQDKVLVTATKQV